MTLLDMYTSESSLKRHQKTFRERFGARLYDPWEPSNKEQSCAVYFKEGGSLEAKDCAGLAHAILNCYGDAISGYRYPDIKEVRVYHGDDEDGVPVDDRTLKQFIHDLDLEMLQIMVESNY